jgi:hypothetical protein
LEALGHILVVEPSCLAGNIHKYYDFAFLHKNSAGGMHGWMKKILKISMDLASLLPFSKVNS